MSDVRPTRTLGPTIRLWRLAPPCSGQGRTGRHSARRRDAPARLAGHDPHRRGHAPLARDVPDRAELLMFAWEEDGEIVGWGTAGREWWRRGAGPRHPVVAVDPGRRGEGIGSALAAAATSTSRRSASRRRGPARSTSRAPGRLPPDSDSPSSAPRPPSGRRSAHGDAGARPGRRPHRPVRATSTTRDRSTSWTSRCRTTSRTRSSTESSFEEWTSEFWRSPLIDQDASLAAFVGDELAAMTMIRIDRPSGRAQNNVTGTRRRSAVGAWRALLKTHSLHIAGSAAPRSRSPTTTRRTRRCSRSTRSWATRRSRGASSGSALTDSS